MLFSLFGRILEAKNSFNLLFESTVGEIEHEKIRRLISVGKHVENDHDQQTSTRREQNVQGGSELNAGGGQRAANKHQCDYNDCPSHSILSLRVRAIAGSSVSFGHVDCINKQNVTHYERGVWYNVI